MSVVIDRSGVGRALAKAIAYKECGKDAEAACWARRLVTLLECADILTPETYSPRALRRVDRKHAGSELATHGQVFLGPDPFGPGAGPPPPLPGGRRKHAG